MTHDTGGPARPGPLHAADFSPPLSTRLLVLQPTPFCNIDCSYCYLPARADAARMSPRTAAMAARRLREDGLAGDELTVVWHAGEPLVIRPAWYEEAIAAIAAELPGCRVRHALQTNATLLDDAWCSFLRRHDIDVGVSVDGPAHLHDRHRRTRTGAGTHAAVVRGLQRLRVHGVPFHAIAVVTAATLAEPDAFYDWFEAQGVTELGCNVDEAEGPHARSSLHGGEAAHALFLQRLLQRARTGRVVVREFTAAWQALRHPLPRWQWRDHTWPENTQAMPLAIVSVAHDGRWSTFSPELLGQPDAGQGGFTLGNVHDAGYLHALRGPRLPAWWAAIVQGVLACQRRCPWFEQCGGGAPANKWYEAGSFTATETLHCRSMVQRPFETVLRDAESALGLAA